MRKGFTLTLSALATVFLATSALALGPTVSNVPDVYISNAGVPAETFTNMFRYTDALVLWDYVKPGVTSGTGSTSNTLFWTWAAKNADYATKLGTGSFLDPATAATDPNGIHYSIAQQNGAVVPAIQVTGADIVAWTPQINAAPGLASHGLDVAGKLTFRNIRLSPPPDASYPAPTAMPATLPAGVLDFQEASLFVTDGVTSPQNYDKVLLVTVDTGPDKLSGGPVWEPVADVSNTTPFGAALYLGLYAPMASQDVAAVINPPAVTGNNPGTGLAITVPVPNPNWDASHDAYYAGIWARYVSVQMGQPQGTAVLDPNFLYRVHSTVGSTNAAATSNPSIYTGLNGRAQPPASGGSGQGQSLINAGATWGPKAGTPVTHNGYLVPIAASDSLLWFEVFDPSTNALGGGTITWSTIKLSRVALTSLVAVATKADIPGTTAANFTVATTSPTPAGQFTHFGIAYGSFTNSTVSPTYVRTPNTGSATTLVQSANANNNAESRGFQSMDFGNLFTPTNAGDIILLKATLTGAPVGTSTLPDVWLNLTSQDATGQGMIMFGPYAASGPSASAKDFYAAVDVPAALATAQWGFNFRTTVEANSVNGSITCSHVTVTEYAPPAE